MKTSASEEVAISIFVTAFAFVVAELAVEILVKDREWSHLIVGVLMLGIVFAF